MYPREYNENRYTPSDKESYDIISEAIDNNETLYIDTDGRVNDHTGDYIADAEEI